MHLFVYGTLKRGLSRAPALSRQRFLDEARTQPFYRMYDCGTYPGLVESADGLPISGEVWDVDAACLAQLDRIECVAENLYRRGRIALQPPFDRQDVEAYFY
ncbi:MAG: gamma-glutamylcyclotransferase family protein, partial [Planctomycetaceae bacterium]